MNIGKVNLTSKVFLAPMAGVTDTIYRQICKNFGAALVYTEMISAKALIYNNKKTFNLAKISKNERPCALQLFGREPDDFVGAIKKLDLENVDMIDINMGCPVLKVVKTGAGSCLMKSPEKVAKIIYYTKNLLGNVPLTIKIRKGYDNSKINAVEIAKICEENGADAITIHGKTKEQLYKPPVDLDIIAKVKNSVSIPVIGNGEIKSGNDAKVMTEKTNCDFVMVGRAAIGNPFIFQEINHILKNQPYTPPTITQRVNVMKTHVKGLCEYEGTSIGIKEAKSHIAMYIKGFKNAADLRNKAFKLQNLDDFENFCELLIEEV